MIRNIITMKVLNDIEFLVVKGKNEVTNGEFCICLVHKIMLV